MKKKSYAIYTTMLVIISLVFSASQASAQSNYTGTWKLDTLASEFNKVPSGRAAVKELVITQDQQQITIEKLAVNTDGQPYRFRETLAFDGSTTENPVPYSSPRKITKSSSVKTEADGKSLLQNSKYHVEEADHSQWMFAVSERYGLSADGKTLTIEKTSISPAGTEKVKAVYAKNKAQ